MFQGLGVDCPTFRGGFWLGVHGVVVGVGGGGVGGRSSLPSARTRYTGTPFCASAMSLVVLSRGASHGSASSLASNWLSRPSRWTLRGYDCSS